MKKVLCVLLTVLMLLAIVPMTAMAVRGVSNEDDLKVAIKNKWATIDILDNFTVTKPISIKYDVTINGNGKTITGKLDTYDATHAVLSVTGGAEVTLANLTVDADDNFRYALYVNGKETVVNLNNVTLDQSNTIFADPADETIYGAPMQINTAKLVTVSGNFKAVTGARSWAAIDVDPVDKGAAKLNFADGANVVLADNRSLLFRTNPIIRTPFGGKNIEITGKFVEGEMYKSLTQCGYCLNPIYALNQADLDGAAHGVNKAEVSSAQIVYSGKWFMFNRFFGKNTYVVTTESEGVFVKKIQCSVDGKNWRTGAIFTADLALQQIYVRITDSEGNVTNWLYDGKKTVNIDGVVFQSPQLSKDKTLYGYVVQNLGDNVAAKLAQDGVKVMGLDTNKKISELLTKKITIYDQISFDACTFETNYEDISGILFYDSAYGEIVLTLLKTTDLEDGLKNYQSVNAWSFFLQKGNTAATTDRSLQELAKEGYVLNAPTRS